MTSSMCCNVVCKCVVCIEAVGMGRTVYGERPSNTLTKRQDLFDKGVLDDH